MADRTTESSLTSIESDEDDVQMDDPPRPSAKTAYEYIVPLIKTFNATVENLTLPEELKEDWNESTTTLMARAVQRAHKVAIVGRTGVGKSTLLNALLQHQVLTASASGACTAVTTEISYKDVKNIEAVVEFISKEQWEMDLSRLIEDVTDTTVDTQEGPAENSTVSLSYQAREKVLGVYPQLQAVSDKSWTVRELMDDPLVNRYLGQTSVFSASESANFQKELEQFLASALSSSGTRKLWPLVKIVKIMGRFEVLSTGITLVDLPGHGDVDNVRDTMANEYLKSADTICLVAGITRAKDDRDIHSYLHKHLSQIIIDGRVQEKSILLILTGTDSPIGSNEITLDSEQQAIVDTLKQEALALGAEITDLVAKKEKKEKSKGKKKNEHLEKYKDLITEKRAQKESKIREKNRLLALGRSEIVKSALHEKCVLLYRELSRLEKAVPDIPIFCLGSRDYLSLAQLEPDPSVIFLEKEETGIPKLRRYFERDGERRNLTDAIGVVTNFFQFLSRISQFYLSPGESTASVSKIPDLIDSLEMSCGYRLNELVKDIKKRYSDLIVVVEKAVGEAEEKSPEIFERKSAFKWNQYRAMMRQDGQYEGGNLNADLTQNILPAIQKDWFDAVNTKIPLDLGEFKDDIQTLLNETVKSISTQSPQYHKGTVRKALGLDSFLEDLESANMTATKSSQRQGSRTWEPMMKNLLKPQYAKVSTEKGPGMYKRMKSRNSEYIRSHASDIFGQMNSTVRHLFDETVVNIEGHNRTEFMRLCKHMRQYLLGVDTCPEVSALEEAEKLVKAFTLEHEDPTCTVLDELKTRLQQIPHPLA